MSKQVAMFLYNPTQKRIFVRDLDIKINPGETVNVKKYNRRLTDEQLAASVGSGSVHDLIRAGSLIMSTSDTKVIPPYVPFVESRKPIPRRQLLAPISKERSSNFIERLQQDFGDRAVPPQEYEVAKNTENLINSVDFDGFDDPLE